MWYCCIYAHFIGRKKMTAPTKGTINWVETSWDNFKLDEYGGVGYRNSDSGLGVKVKILIGDNSVVVGEIIYIIHDEETQQRVAEILPDGTELSLYIPFGAEYEHFEKGHTYEPDNTIRVFIAV
jgi:hypothetical protein